jgi:pilus assembly protein CpaF
MLAMAGMHISPLSLKRYISSAVDVIIQIARLSDGSRKVTSLQEVTGMEGEVISMSEIFHFRQTGVGAEGKVQGQFRSNGIRPKFAARLETMGIGVEERLFNPDNVLEA